MPKSKTWLTLLAVISAVAVWFGILMPWDKLPDPDAFYHATMARLFWEQGPIISFPWLDLTTLGRHFADQHFLWHAVQSPFVHYFGLTQGSRLSSLIFAVLLFVGLYLVLYSLHLKPVWLWTLALACMHPFDTRLVLGKASPLVILFWIVALYAFSKYGKSNQKNLFLCSLTFVSSLLFTLTHGGWILIPISMIVMLVGDILYSMALGGKAWREALRSSPWPIILASFLGIFVGILLHPGRSELLGLLWIQVFKVGVATPSNLPMGVEWEGVGLGPLLSMASVFSIILILLIPGLAFARKTIGASDESDAKGRMRLALMWGFIVAMTAAMTLKSARFAEFFQPAIGIWAAILFQFVDWQKLMSWLDFGKGRLAGLLMPAVLSISLFAIVTQGLINSYSVLHKKDRFYDGQYQAAMQAISQEAKPGDRVYHSEWDEFPVLFAQDQRLRYVAGLDPTFFYEADPELALEYVNLPFKAGSSTQMDIWSLVHDRLRAKFALVDIERWPDLAKLFDSDSRFQKIGEGNGAKSYKLAQ